MSRFRVKTNYLKDIKNAEELEKFVNWMYEHDAEFRRMVDERMNGVVDEIVKELLWGIPVMKVES